MTTILDNTQLASYQRRIKAALPGYDLVDEGNGVYSIVSDFEGDLPIPGLDADGLERELSDIERWRLEHGTDADWRRRIAS